MLFILAVLLALAIVGLGVLAVALKKERDFSSRAIDQILVLEQDKARLQKSLAKRRERHLRASGYITKQRAQLRERDEELERAGRWIQLLFELLDELKFDDRQITLSRNEARRLFVA